MTTLLEKLGAIEDSLRAGSIPHAFGGALALAFCTGQPRATIDIDVNVFLPTEDTDRLLEALPGEVTWSEDDRERLERDGQVRLWWDSTPVDVFLSTSAFHQAVAERAHERDVGGTTFPFLACQDLAVFKAFFNRRKDWADLEAMLVSQSFDLDQALGVLTRLLGPDDERVAMLLEVSRTLPPHDQR